MSMLRIALIHWKIDEIEVQVEQLANAGYEVDSTLPNGPPYLRRLGEYPPVAVIVDLTRRPSHGREIAMSIRMRKATRRIPIIFIGGVGEKVDRIQQILPDAIYTDWPDILSVLERVTGRDLFENGAPIVPQTIFDAYAGTPLIQKLGIKEGAKVGLYGEPSNFFSILGILPEGVTFHKGTSQDCELVIWFVYSQKELQEEIEKMVGRLTRGSMWIAWRKKTSGKSDGLTQQLVRECGMANNLVDYKICSIDETWSALLFTHRM